MTTKRIFSNHLNQSRFIIELTKAVLPLFSRDLKQFSEDKPKQNFESYGNSQEQLLKEVMSLVGKLQSYFEDLENVLIHLKVEKSKISNLYGDKLDIEDYYKYHYDNFVIRIMTSIDICGKIGIAIYELGIQERHANWYSFANAAE